MDKWSGNTLKYVAAVNNEEEYDRQVGSGCFSTKKNDITTQLPPGVRASR